MKLELPEPTVETEAQERWEVLDLQETTAPREDLCQDPPVPWEDQEPKDPLDHEGPLELQESEVSREYKDPPEPTLVSRTVPQERKEPPEHQEPLAKLPTTSSSTLTSSPSTRRGTWRPNVWTA